MKIYIDFSKEVITKVDNSVAYVGDVFSNTFEVLFYNYGADLDWFPTMSQLAPNSREAGDFNSDALDVDETYEHVENGITYMRYTFTIGEGWVRMKGRSNFFIWVNKLIENDTALQRKCYGKISVVLNESTDNYFIQDVYLNPKVKEYIDNTIGDDLDSYKSTIDDEVESQNETIASLMQASPSVFDTASNIALLTENKGVAVATDTGYIYYWDSTLATPAYVSSGLQYNDLTPYATKNYVGNPNTWVESITWEAGSISSSNGGISSTTNRIRTANFLTFDESKIILNLDKQRIKVFAYNSANGYLGTVDWTWENYELKQLKVTFSNVAYYKIIVQISETLYSTFNNVIIGTLPYIVIEKDKPLNNKYYGEKIDLNNAFDYIEYLTINSGQGGTAIAVDTGRFLFDFDKDGNVYIYNLDNMNLASTKVLPNVVPPHANCVCFGTEKYDNGDYFPLIYVNRYNATPSLSGICYVYRISSDLSNFTLVQTITIGFTNNSLWSEAGDSRPFGNFIVDTDNNYLYAYTLLDTSKKTRVFKFALPTLSQGSSVTLELTDVIDYFDLPYYAYIQDCAYHNGKLYMTSGFGYSPSFAYIHVINLTSKQEVSTINLCEVFGVGANYEPELIYVLKNQLYMAFGNGKLYKFKF